MTRLRLFTVVVSVAVASVASVGFYLAGSPTTNRMAAFDAQRLNDLQSITSAIDQHWSLHAKLPTDLDALQQTREVYLSSIRDPRTGTAYAFRKTDADSYELCATFELASATADERTKSPYSAPYPMGPGGVFWEHPAGEKCYTLDVNKPPKPLPL